MAPCLVYFCFLLVNYNSHLPVRGPWLRRCFEFWGREILGTWNLMDGDGQMTLTQILPNRASRRLCPNQRPILRPPPPGPHQRSIPWLLTFDQLLLFRKSKVNVQNTDKNISNTNSLVYKLTIYYLYRNICPCICPYIKYMHFYACVPLGNAYRLCILHSCVTSVYSLVQIIWNIFLS